MRPAGKSRLGRNDPSVVRDNALFRPDMDAWGGTVPLKIGADCIDERLRQEEL